MSGFAASAKPSSIRKIVIGIVGMTVLGIGTAMIALPGPAFIVIPLGLAILATEFLWARRWLDKARGFLDRAPKKNGCFDKGE